jgi:hypothetical protein
LKRDEVEWEVIEWNGIRVGFEELKDWAVRRIASFPSEHRISLVQKCHRFLQFNDSQLAELCRLLFLDEFESSRKFMKNFRKTLTTGILGWKPIVEGLRSAVAHWSPQEIKDLTRE